MESAEVGKPLFMYHPGIILIVLDLNERFPDALQTAKVVTRRSSNGVPLMPFAFESPFR